MKEITVILEGREDSIVITALDGHYLRVEEGFFEIKIWAYRAKVILGISSITGRHVMASFKTSKVVSWIRTA